MIPAGTNEISRNLDKISVEYGVPSFLLMENAAFSLFQEASKIIEEFKPESIVLLAGSGGNGGDGFALLRMIDDRIGSIPLYSVNFFEADNLTGDTLKNFTLLPEVVNFIELHQVSGKVFFIDAILGTGLKRELDSHVLNAVRFVNSYPNKKVLSVDVPTGLSADTGLEMPEAIKADVTVSLGVLKTGLFLEKGILKSGKIVYGSISANSKAKEVITTFVAEEKDFAVSEIRDDFYKNKNGHALFIGGSIKKIGAIFIAAQSFLAAGGGLATVAVAESFFPLLAGKFPEIMLEDIKELRHQLNKYDVMVIGPGLSEEFEYLPAIIRDFEGTIVADAGFFDLMTENNDLYLYLEKKNVVFTPHPGELRRFMKADKEEPWINLVKKFPLNGSHVLYAKNSASFIKNLYNEIIIPHGAKALSFGGTGDMLTGIIAAFSGKTETLLEASFSAGIIQRRAGLLLEERFAPEFHSIKKLIELIPESIQIVRGENEFRGK